MRRFAVVFILVVIFLSSSLSVFAQQSVAAKNRYKVAKNMFTSGQYESAEKELEEALKLDAHYGDALYLAGLTKLNLKKYSESETFFKRLISEQPKFYTARLYLASVYLALDDIKKAEEQVEYYITNMSADPAGHYSKGVLKYKEGKLNEALQAWEKALSLDKDHVYSLYNKGVVLFLQDKTEEALKFIEKALSLRSNNYPPYRFTIAHIKYLTGKIDEALKEFKYLSESDPSSVIGLTSSGFAKLCEKKYDEALTDVEDALKLEKFSPALELKSYILEEKKEYLEALKCCEEILEKDQNNKIARNRIDILKEKAEIEAKKGEATGEIKTEDNPDSGK